MSESQNTSGTAPPREQAPWREQARPHSYEYDPRRKSVVLACCLSFVPGLGHIYVGFYQRGFMHALTFAGIIASLVALSERRFTPLIPLLGIFLGFFYLYNLIDGARRAWLYNLALSGVASGLPTDELEMAGMRGSLFGGTILIGIGVLLLMHTRFDMSMEWVEDWWPVAPIIFGVYLVAKSLKARRPGS